MAITPCPLVVALERDFRTSFCIFLFFVGFLLKIAAKKCPLTVSRFVFLRSLKVKIDSYFRGSKKLGIPVFLI